MSPVWKTSLQTQLITINEVSFEIRRPVRFDNCGHLEVGVQPQLVVISELPLCSRLVHLGLANELNIRCP